MRKLCLFFGFILFARIVSGQTNDLTIDYKYKCGGQLAGFNGTSSYIEAEWPQSIGAYSISIAAWVRCEVNLPTGGEMGIYFRNINGDFYPYTSAMHGLVINTRGEFMFRGEFTQTGADVFFDSLSSNFIPKKGTFYHVAATFDQDTKTCSIYVNGELKNSKSVNGILTYPNGVNYKTSSIGSRSYYFGSFNQGFSSFFNGYIDDVVIAIKPWTKAQIDTIANKTSLTDEEHRRFNIWAHWNFEKIAGSATVNAYIPAYSATGFGQYAYFSNGAFLVTTTCTENKPPVANAGPDQTITLPTSSVTLDGSLSSDPDGSIVKYQWSLISAPASGGGSIASPGGVTTNVTDLKEGTYVFRLTVTDNKGATASDDVQVVVKAAGKYITVAGLRVYADNVPTTKSNPRIVSGNVFISPDSSCAEDHKIFYLAGDVVVDTVLNTISGSDRIYCSNVGNLQNINLYSSPYKFYVVNDLLTWNLGQSTPDLLSLLKLSFLNTYFKNIKVLCDGIQVSSKINLPKGVYKNVNSNEREYDISVNNLFLTSKGIYLAGGVKLSGLTYKGLMGLDNLELNYNYNDDEFEGKVRLLAYLFNLDASAKIKNSVLTDVNFGIAAGMIPLPSLYGWGIDSVGGGAKDLDKDTATWTLGARITPVAKYAIRSFGNLRISGTYRLGTFFTGAATYTMFKQNVVGGEITYRAANKYDSAGLITLKGNLDLFKVVKGDASIAINTSHFSKLTGTANMSLNIPKFEGFWKFLNKLYPSGEIFSSSNYFTNEYLAGTAQQNSILVPRLFYRLGWKNNWEWEWGINSSIVPLEAQKNLNLRTGRNFRTAGNPLTYSFAVNTPTSHIIINAKGTSVPSPSVYLTNGDSLNSQNYQSHNNVLYLTDTLNATSTFIISNPPQGVYYVWSSDADTIEIDKINQAPRIVIDNIIDNRTAMKLTASFSASDPDNDAQILFGLDRDKSNTDGIILSDSTAENASNGQITLDYSSINSGVYYLYASITDSIGQNNYFYYSDPIKIIAHSAPNAPSNLSVSTTDTSLTLKFNKNNLAPCNYLIHYTDSKIALDLNSKNFAVGDTNFVEISDLPAGRPYQFAVSAVDSNANESDLSNIATVSWTSSKLNNAPSFTNDNPLSKIKAGATYRSTVTATDPDNDALDYRIIKAPAGIKVSNAGEINWNPNPSNVGHNEVGVKVTDKRGGSDSTFFDVFVYNSTMAAPSVYFNKTAFELYTEKPLIEILDFLADEINTINLRIFSSSDPNGIQVPAKRTGDRSSSFWSEISFASTQSSGNSIKVSKGDTLWVQYVNSATGESALNYALFNYLKADFVFNDSLCSSSPIKFYNASKGANLKYEWDFGDKTSSGETNPEHLFSTQNGENKFTVTLKVTNSQSTTDSISKTVIVVPSVVTITTSGKTSLCKGDSVILMSSSPLNNQWYRNDTLLDKATQASFVAKVDGNYSVHVNGSQNGCMAISAPVTVTTITAGPTPHISLPGTSSFCSGDSIQLTSSIGSGNQWYRNDTAINGATDPLLVVHTAGNYTVKTFNNGCVSAASNVVSPTVLPLPTGTISAASPSICPGSTDQLSVSGGSSYQWYKDNVAISNDTASNYEANAAGVYSVEIFGSNGCRAKAGNSITLTQLNKPNAGFSFDSYCINQPVRFTNLTTGSNLTFAWNFGDNQSAAAVSPQHTYNKQGIYTVSLVASLNGCPDSAGDTVKKTIKIEMPVPGVKYTTVQVSYGRPMQLSARDIGKSYHWVPPTDLDNPASRTPVITPRDDRNYAIQITTASGCVTTDSLTVAMLKDINVFVPTAFMPNGNGSNDLLRPILINVVSINYFRIYNRWGQLVYETKTVNDGWNGNYQGKPQPMETYTWIFEGTDIKGNAIKASGKSVLLR